MSAMGSSESRLQSLTDPSEPQEARHGSLSSRSSVARGLNTMEPTWLTWPRNVRTCVVENINLTIMNPVSASVVTSLQSGTVHSLARPDHDPVTSILLLGLNWQLLGRKLLLSLELLLINLLLLNQWLLCLQRLLLLLNHWLLCLHTRQLLHRLLLLD